jgi:uncharacterized membrane protein YfcA
MGAHQFIEPLYSISGFAVGMLVGMTGVGGGSLMTPLLILLFGIHPATAVGTDLLYAAVTKTGGSLVHNFSHTIDWRLVRRLACGSVPMTIVTLMVLSRFDLQGPGVRTMITAVLSGALFLTAALLIFRRTILQIYTARVGDLGSRRTALFTVIVGAVLGVLVSISSVGAGAIGVTALVLLYPRMPIRMIVGSDIAHAVPLTLVAGIGHWILGSIDWHILLSLLLGSLPGIVLGSTIAVRVPETVLRLTLAATLILVAGKFALDLRRPAAGEVLATQGQRGEGAAASRPSTVGQGQ